MDSGILRLGRPQSKTSLDNKERETLNQREGSVDYIGLLYSQRRVHMANAHLQDL